MLDSPARPLDSVPVGPGNLGHDVQVGGRAPLGLQGEDVGRTRSGDEDTRPPKSKKVSVS